MKVVVLLVALLAVAQAVPLEKPKHHRLRDLCRKGFREVAGGQCCPKDQPVLVDNSCYSHCEEGQDDMVLGSWVGCRTQCEPGASSTLSSCSRGPLVTERVDHSRSGSGPVPQTKVKPLAPGTDPSVLDDIYLPRFCKATYVPVARRRNGSGGCCPADSPTLIAGKCYAACEQGFDNIQVGHFVGCRKQCPDGWDQSTNTCAKSGEETVERGDFPREGVVPHDRKAHGKPQPPKNPKVTCPVGYVSVANSDTLCCPWDHGELIGALCYEECPEAYVSAGFGCRHTCPSSAGWVTYPLTCTNWRVRPAKTILRKGWERSPVVPKQALSSSTPAPAAPEPGATGAAGASGSF